MGVYVCFVFICVCFRLRCVCVVLFAFVLFIFACVCVVYICVCVRVRRRKDIQQINFDKAMFFFPDGGKFSTNVMRQLVLVLSHLFGRRYLHPKFQRRPDRCPSSKVI